MLTAAVHAHPNDHGLLTKLILAYYSNGEDVPEHLLDQLPPLPELTPEQIAAFEQAAIASPGSHSRKRAESEPEPQSVKPKKKSKKKKIRYPKGFDPANPGPPPDPERWLPRYERAKGRRRNQVNLRGPQGAVPISNSSATQGSGRSRAHRAVDDKNYLDNQRQKVQAAAAATSTNTNNSKKKKGKKRR